MNAPVENAQHQNLNSNHISPPEYVDAAREVMGSIDCDPCSSYAANKHIVKARVFYTPSVNGYKQPWAGNMWENPPGGYCNLDGECAPRDSDGVQKKGNGYNESSPRLWFRRTAQFFVLGHVKQFCYMAFSIEQLCSLQDMDDPYPGIHGKTANGQRYPFYWCLIRDRPRYLTYLGNGQFESQNSPTHNGAIVYGGPNGKKFMKVFSRFGAVMRPE